MSFRSSLRREIEDWESFDTQGLAPLDSFEAVKIRQTLNLIMSYLKENTHK